MAKFIKRTIKNPPSVSATLCDEGPMMNGYVWDTSKNLKQDPFFAVPSLVLDNPVKKIESDSDVKVSISF